MLLAFCYQFGVFLSRSSLQLIRIRRVEWLTVLQAGNFVLWVLQAYYKLSNAWPFSLLWAFFLNPHPVQGNGFLRFLFPTR